MPQLLGLQRAKLDVPTDGAAGKVGRMAGGGARQCSIANALGVVGERWSLLALREIFFGHRRFDQIARNTGASRDILAARLTTLVSAGVLVKRQYEKHPPRYEYTLTEAGRALQPVLLNLMEWGDRYVTVGDPPTVWRHECGAEFHPRTVCTHCGGFVGPDELVPVRVGAVGSSGPQDGGDE